VVLNTLNRARFTVAVDSFIKTGMQCEHFFLNNLITLTIISYAVFSINCAHMANLY
jgi:hypothetical protein